VRKMRMANNLRWLFWKNCRILCCGWIPGSSLGELFVQCDDERRDDRQNVAYHRDSSRASSESA